MLSFGDLKKVPQVFMRFALGVLIFSLFASVGCGSSNDDNAVSDSVLTPGVDDMVDQSIGSGPGAPADENPVETKPSPDIQATDMEQSAGDFIDPTVDEPSAEPTTPPPEMDGPADVPSAEPMDASGPDETMGDEQPSADDRVPQDNADRPQYPTGPSDIVARRACALLDEPPQELQIVELESEAGQVLLTPQPETRFSFTIPETGFGFVTLEVPDWAITIAAFSHFEQTVTILDPDGVTEEIVPLSWNGACPEKGLTDHRTKYHSWGSFTVKVEGEPNTEMTLVH